MRISWISGYRIVNMKLDMFLHYVKLEKSVEKSMTFARFFS